MQGAGFYHNMDLRPSQTYRNFNTWMVILTFYGKGDPVRAYQAEVIINQIQSLNLLKVVQETGDFLKKELLTLSVKYPHFISNVRGMGTYLAFDAESMKMRDSLVSAIRNSGVNLGGSGERAIRIRPMLIFSERHAIIFLEKLNNVLQSMDNS
jgi:4-aminobutyrate aminotransferase/(S)-3-amino-2-methylpropionate transaminase